MVSLLLNFMKIFVLSRCQYIALSKHTNVITLKRTLEGRVQYTCSAKKQCDIGYIIRVSLPKVTLSKVSRSIWCNKSKVYVKCCFARDLTLGFFKYLKRLEGVI